MSTQVQRKNHKIHPCDSDKKTQLLSFLIERYPTKNILLISTQPLKQVVSSENVTTITDDSMSSNQKNHYDILISYDLPHKALTYMTRFAHACEIALILLDNDDQKHLYGIETLLGRTISQEVIAGFEPSFGIAVEQENKAKALERRRAREEEQALKSDKWVKKEKEKSQYLGNDETGKPIFSKKSRERNHYIDGTPRSAEEKANQSRYKSKPVFFGDKSDSNKPKSDDSKKPLGDKKKEFGDKKPYSNNTKTNNSHQESKPASTRVSKTINVKSLKPKETKE